MAHQVRAKLTKIVGRLCHHVLIKIIVIELLQRRNVASTYFLFLNKFEIELQPEDKRKPSSKKYSTPRNGKRKRRAISPIAIDQASAASKTKKAKRNLDFNEKTKKEEALAQDKNVLNLPYTDSKDEEEQGTNLANQVVVGHEDVPSPTPKDDQSQQVAEASSSKPKESGSQKINQLLRQVYELEVLEREIKRTNGILTKRNAELYDSLQEIKRKYTKMEESNITLMK